MFKKLKRHIKNVWNKAWTKITDDRLIVTVRLPQRAVNVLLEKRLNPEDNLEQILKDSIPTHLQIMGALKEGWQIWVKRGDELRPLDLSHIITPETKKLLSSITATTKRK